MGAVHEIFIKEDNRDYADIHRTELIYKYLHKCELWRINK